MHENLLAIEQHIFNNDTYLKTESKAILGKKKIAVKNYPKIVILVKKIKKVAKHQWYQ